MPLRGGARAMQTKEVLDKALARIKELEGKIEPKKGG
jgi:hypothetical protein